MIINIAVWAAIAILCFVIYKKVNRKIGDDPKDLTVEEKINASINSNKQI